jgi:hypothetical protein
MPRGRAALDSRFRGNDGGDFSSLFEEGAEHGADDGGADDDDGEEAAERYGDGAAHRLIDVFPFVDFSFELINFFLDVEVQKPRRVEAFLVVVEALGIVDKLQ